MKYAACWNTEAIPQAKANFTGQGLHGPRKAEIGGQRADVSDQVFGRMAKSSGGKTIGMPGPETFLPSIILPLHDFAIYLCLERLRHGLHGFSQIESVLIRVIRVKTRVRGKHSWPTGVSREYFTGVPV